MVYAFFETQDNYAITHRFDIYFVDSFTIKSDELIFGNSCWHAIMAIALLFLVPSMKTDEEEEEVGGKGTDTETYYELIGEEGSHLARVTPR